jgi:hypothetical protein
MDRSALLALASPSSLPALYGGLGDGRRGLEFSHFEQDPFFYVSASVMDLGNPSYRAWRIRYLLYKLADYGIAPSDGACLMEAYKPGWYGYYDDVARGSSNDTCSVPGTHLWTGPAHVCSDGRAPGGPFDSGLYGPGEFEVGLNAYFRELFAALAAAGYTDVRIITTERPSYGPEIWSLLDPDVKASPQLVGEWDTAIEPSLGQIAAQGPKSGPPATPPPSPQAPPSPSTPQPPAASDGGSPPAADPVAPSPAAPAPRERRHRSDGRFLPAEDGGGDAVILAPSLKGVR